MYDSLQPYGLGPPGSSVHAILQAEYWRGLPCPPSGDLPDPEIEFTSPGSPALQGDSLLLSHWGSPRWIMYLVAQSCPTLCNPWTVVRQASLSMGILQAIILEWAATSSSGDLSNPRIEPVSPALAGRFFTVRATWEALAPRRVEPGQCGLLCHAHLLPLVRAPPRAQKLLSGSQNPICEHWPPELTKSK